MKKPIALILFATITLLFSGCSVYNQDQQQVAKAQQKQSVAKDEQQHPRTIEQQLAKAVEMYNQTLIKVMNTGNAEILNEFAVDKEVRRTSLFLSALNAEHKRMTADLLSFKVTKVEPDTNQQPPQSTLVDVDGNPVGSSVYEQPGKYSLVQTEELWEHQNYDQITGDKMGEPFRVRYLATYWLEKLNGKWLVSRINFEEKPVQ